MSYYFSKRSKAFLDTVHPILQHIFQEAITDSPIDFGISSGRRTAEEQNVLYNDKKSTKDGYIKISYHQSGKAVDVYAYVNGKASYDVRHLSVLAGHILGTANTLGYELIWGADWDSDWNIDEHTLIDMPHFEIHDE
jgi:peptidoglycan L-alanyl-D-glutamate endopeptidase CwlK